MIYTLVAQQSISCVGRSNIDCCHAPTQLDYAEPPPRFYPTCPRCRIVFTARCKLKPKRNAGDGSATSELCSCGRAKLHLLCRSRRALLSRRICDNDGNDGDVGCQRLGPTGSAVCVGGCRRGDTTKCDENRLTSGGCTRGSRAAAVTQLRVGVR